MRFALGVVLGAVAMFVWGAVFWMNPLPMRFFEETPDEEAAQAALREVLDGSGLYFVPSGNSGQEEFAERHREGPVAYIHYQAEGSEPMPPTTLLWSFLHNLASVLLAGLLLRWVVGALGGYGARVGFVAFVGLVGAVFVQVGDAIWWMQPWGFTALLVFYAVGAWVVTGLVLAAFVKPTENPREESTS